MVFPKTPEPIALSLGNVIENSFANFHAKGVDYLCIEREVYRTIKVYFFDDYTPEGEPLVAPHNHRYPFRTTVLAGEMTNYRYAPSSLVSDAPIGSSVMYNRFDYLTPLNGGDGFTYNDTIALTQIAEEHYVAGDRHAHRARELHTIRVQNDTVILLEQGPDELPIGFPTSTFLPFSYDKTPPSLDGLYDKFDEARARRRLGQLATLLNRPIILK